MEKGKVVVLNSENEHKSFYVIDNLSDSRISIEKVGSNIVKVLGQNYFIVKPDMKRTGERYDDLIIEEIDNSNSEIKIKENGIEVSLELYDISKRYVSLINQ